MHCCCCHANVMPADIPYTCTCRSCAFICILATPILKALTHKLELCAGGQGQGWEPEHALGGHYGAVVDMCWGVDGSCLLTASTDQTCRITVQNAGSWSELARPQVLQATSLITRFPGVVLYQDLHQPLAEQPFFYENFATSCSVTVVQRPLISCAKYDDCFCPALL